jgi:hypothetical protein
MDGLDDMLPALREVWQDPDAAARLRPLLGPRPLLASLGLGLLALALGIWFDQAGPELPGKEFVSWPALFLGLMLAILLRRFLFQSPHGNESSTEFTQLAATLIPAIAVVLIGIALTGGAGVHPGSSSGPPGWLGSLSMLVESVTDLLGVTAALVIAVASLCYSKAWMSALMDLATRLFVFRIMIWITSLILIEIGIFGKIAAGLLDGLLGISFPQWLPELLDLLSLAGLLSVAYLAVIGGTWTVCRDTYAELLAEGHVDILARLAELVGGDDKGDQASPVISEEGQDQS